ncbi:MAG: hypothetical protein VXZ82_19620 [Planctomycetota bacterium]|nr:hypothetical protein [Planctomycetota bacterium]
MRVIQISDGTGNKLMVVEVDKSLAIASMSPTDIDMENYLDNSFITETRTGRELLPGGWFH